MQTDAIESSDKYIEQERQQSLRNTIMHNTINKAKHEMAFNQFVHTCVKVLRQWVEGINLEDFDQMQALARSVMNQCK